MLFRSIRTANNSHQYPCSGGSHDCGQLISGCVWSLRNELVVTEPVDYRDIGASLFVNMLIVRGQMVPGSSTIDPLITVIYLTLDDDDANIGNGTPHYPEIADAFGSHNMDAPPLELVEFTYPQGRPQNVPPSGGSTAFTFEVTPISATPVPQTGTLYLDRGAGIESFSLPEVASNEYALNFPSLPLPCGSSFTYYVGVQTSSGEVLDPPGAPTVRFDALVATSATMAFEDTFETNLGWTVSGSATTGQWQRGIPADGNRGDPPTDADGSSRCFVTGNTAGDSDVDGGSTLLLSPALDATAGTGDAYVTYYRWFSNNTGAATDDVFIVQISNNGGSSWVTLETVGVTSPEASGGWYEKVFRVADHIAPTNNMRLRFNASDLGSGSIVEAGVDHVRMLNVSCTGSKFRQMVPGPTVDFP